MCPYKLRQEKNDDHQNCNLIYLLFTIKSSVTGVELLQQLELNIQISQRNTIFFLLAIKVNHLF